MKQYTKGQNKIAFISRGRHLCDIRELKSIAFAWLSFAKVLIPDIINVKVILKYEGSSNIMKKIMYGFQNYLPQNKYI